MKFLTIILTIFAVSHAQDGGSDLSPRIWYGERADIKDYPFYAGILCNGGQYCGAAILSKRWLVTAAHCAPPDVQGAYVWVGAEDENNAIKYKIVRAVSHPGYEELHLQKEGLVVNDIALLKVKRRMTFSDKVKPIQLPQQDYQVNVLHSFAGMGKDENLEPSQHLMEVTTRTRDIKEYLKQFKKTNEFRRMKPLISKAMMCTKRDGDMPSMCFGDSGSALVRDNTLVGIASFLGNKGKCDVVACILFTNVFSYVDWIKSVTGLP